MQRSTTTLLAAVTRILALTAGSAAAGTAPRIKAMIDFILKTLDGGTRSLPAKMISTLRTDMTGPL